MIEKIFVYAAISFAVGLALAYLKKGAGKFDVQIINGLTVLRMNKLYGIVGIISIVFGAGFLFFPALSNEYNQGTFIIVGITLLIFWGAGIPCFMYYKNHRLKFNEEIITVKSVLGKEETIKWQEINQIKFNHLSGYLILVDNKGEKIKAHQHLVGLTAFVKMIETKTSWTAKELKLPVNN